MKKSLIAAALAVASLASHADVIGFLPNEAGGRINLSDERMACAPGTYYAFSTSAKDNSVSEGCWTTIAGQARITFDGTRVRMYALANFWVTPYGAANGWKAPDTTEERARPAQRATAAGSAL